jgi:hypothetical protein
VASLVALSTAWLKTKIDAFIDGTVAVLKATKLATARTLSISGAGNGSVDFDGSANANIVLTLAASGAVAGTYPKVTINVKGLVTGGAALVAADIPSLDWSKINSGKPTTLGGYGITDAQPLDATLTALAAQVTAANQLIYSSGVDAFAMTALTAFARTLLDDADAATALATLGAAALASPTFTGNPAAPTPAQFDNDTSLATTEFVQRALGSIRGIGSSITASGTMVLTASDVGLLVQAGGTDTVQTIQLPEASSCPSGASIKVRVAKSGGSLQIAVPTGLIATPWNKTSAASFAAETSDTYEFIASPANNTWLGFSRGGGFFASLNANGHQKLTSGLIIQWGTVTAAAAGTAVTLPLAFPNACLMAGANDIVSAGTTIVTTNLDGMAAVSGKSTTSITVHANGTADWFAIGW